MRMCMQNGRVTVKANEKGQACNGHVYGKLPKWPRDMQTWGEAGVVKEGKNGKPGDPPHRISCL